MFLVSIQLMPASFAEKYCSASSKSSALSCIAESIVPQSIVVISDISLIPSNILYRFSPWNFFLAMYAIFENDREEMYKS